MKLRDVIERPSFTFELSNGMHVTIYDAGEWGSKYPHIRVVQDSRDLLNGAPAPDDTPRYDMGGEYEFSLPDATDIAARCDMRNADPSSLDFPGEGHATIDVTHRH